MTYLWGNKMIKEKRNIFFALVAVAIIILSTFTVITQYQVNDLAATAKGKESLPLLVAISADKTSGTIPLKVSFTPIVSNAVGAVEYHWDFGDGNISKETNPTYTYQENGTFICNLSVIDRIGKKESGSVAISAEFIQTSTPSININRRSSSRPYSNAEGGTSRLRILTNLLRNDGIKKVSGNERIVQKMIEEKDNPLYKSLNTLFFSGVNSWITLTAEAANPEDVAEYVWIIQAPVYITSVIGGEMITPVYEFKGKTVELPAAYTYRTGGNVGTYEVTLETKDSNGETIGINTASFEIMPSNTKMRRESILKTTIRDGLVKGFIMTQWKQTWSKRSDSLGYKFMDSFITLFVLTLPENILNMPLLAVGFTILLKTVWGGLDAGVLGVWADFPTQLAKALEKRIDKGKISREEMKDKIEKWSVTPIIKGIVNWNIVKEYLGFINHAPDQMDPFPREDAKQIPINCPYVSITVEDREADLFNVTICGEYVNNVTYNNQNNGTFTATLITPLPENTDITWYVNATDINDNEAIKTYKFETFIDV